MSLDDTCIYGVMCVSDGHCSMCRRHERMRSYTPVHRYLRLIEEMLSGRDMDDFKRSLQRTQKRRRHSQSVGTPWRGKAPKGVRGKAPLSDDRDGVGKGKVGNAQRKKAHKNSFNRSL